MPRARTGALAEGDDWSVMARKKAGDHQDDDPAADDGQDDDDDGQDDDDHQDDGHGADDQGESGGQGDDDDGQDDEKGPGRGRKAAAKGKAAAQKAGRKAIRSAPARRGGRAAVHGGSIVIGLAGYALVINYLRYGSAGVKAYLKAKLINQPTQTGFGAPVVTADYTFRRPAATGQATTGQTVTTGSDAPAPSGASNGGTIFA